MFIRYTPHDAEAVTLSDTAEKSYVGFYVGTAGNVAVTTEAGRDVVFPGCPAGFTCPLRIRRVKTTGTTASNIVGFIGS